MAHTREEKDALLVRIRRIRGQVESIERLLETSADCGPVLQQISACRGAMNGLMAELLEGEIRYHVLSPTTKANSTEARAADQLVSVIRRYLK